MTQGHRGRSGATPCGPITGPPPHPMPPLPKHNHAEWWNCGNCGRRLGEIVGDRVVVKVGPRIISVRVETQPDQVCPRCQTVSVLTYGKMSVVE